MTPLAVACIALGLSLIAGSAIGKGIASANPEPAPPPVDHDRSPYPASWSAESFSLVD